MNTTIVSKETPRPAKIMMSGRMKAADADNGIWDAKAMMPARMRPAPVNAIPSPTNLATRGIFSLGI